MGAVYILFQNSEIGNLMVLQHKYDKAVIIGKSCLAEALRLNYKELILNSYKMLADAYVGLGEKDEAYEYLEKYHCKNGVEVAQIYIDKYFNDSLKISSWSFGLSHLLSMIGSAVLISSSV